MTKISNLYSLTNYITANSSGSISIAAPTSGYALEVLGTGRYSGALSGSSATFTGALSGASATFSGTSGAYIGVTIDNTDVSGSSRLRITSTGSNITDVISYSASHVSRANQAWIGGDGSSTITVLQAGGVEFLRGASTGATTFASSLTSSDAFISTDGTNTIRLQKAYFGGIDAIYQTGTNAFGIYLGGGVYTAAKLYITNGGNVGIGTTSPYTISSGYKALTLDDTNGGGIAMRAGGTLYGLIYAATNELYINSAGGSGQMLFYTAGSERMRISDVGSVSIGMTSSPYGRVAIRSNNTTAYMGLNVYALGNNNFTYMNHDNNVGIIGTEFGSGGTGHTPLAFQAGGSERMRITTGGNVVVGGTTAGTSLNTSVTVNNASAGNYSGLIPMTADVQRGYYGGTSTGLEIGAAGSGVITFYTSGVERMRVTSTGGVGIGTTSASAHKLRVIDAGVAQGATLFATDNNIYNSIQVYTAGADGYNAGATVMIMGRNTSTNRSLNAGGTINASGADYAEYMTKAINDTISKGDIVGVNSNGLLTNMFADAVSFVVKSTDPSYVGGDTWANVDIIGKLSLNPTQQEKDIYNAKVEVARAKVDRIAFSGQVPCNVLNANVGDYIIPIELENGKIGGQAITNPTFEQFKSAVGKVWKIMEDGRAWIKVIN